MSGLKPKREEIMQLIREYIACSTYMCRVLKDEYDTKGETLLRARRLNLIPKEGKLAEGHSFNFHGGGCFFRFENGTIDIDFEPNDRCDGFDAYRLYDFLTTSKKYQNINCSEVELQEAINELLKERKVVQPGLYPNPNLYYLNNEL